MGIINRKDYNQKDYLKHSITISKMNCKRIDKYSKRYLMNTKQIIEELSRARLCTATICRKYFPAVIDYSRQQHHNQHDEFLEFIRAIHVATGYLFGQSRARRIYLCGSREIALDNLTPQPIGIIDGRLKVGMLRAQQRNSQVRDVDLVRSQQSFQIINVYSVRVRPWSSLNNSCDKLLNKNLFYSTS